MDSKLKAKQESLSAHRAHEDEKQRAWFRMYRQESEGSTGGAAAGARRQLSMRTRPG